MDEHQKVAEPEMPPTEPSQPSELASETPRSAKRRCPEAAPKQGSARQADPGFLLKWTEAHRKGVSALAFCPVGKILASGSHDTTVRLFDLQTGQPVGVLKGQQYNWKVKAIAFSPRGHRLVALRQGHRRPRRDTAQALVWDLFTRNRSIVTGREQFLFFVRGLACAPSEEMIALGGRWIELYHLETGEQVGSAFDDSECDALTFTPNGQHIAAGLKGGPIGVWDVAERRQRLRLTGHDDWVGALAFSADGKRLASADDNTLRLWNYRTGKQQRCWKQNDTVFLAFLPDARGLISLHRADGESKVIRWSIDSKKEVHSWTTNGVDAVSSVAVSPDGKYLASGHAFGDVCVWDLETVLPCP